MLDINLILSNPDIVKKAIINKKISQISPSDVDKFIELYNRYKELKKKVEDLRMQRNRNAQLLKTRIIDDKERAKIIDTGKKLKEQIATLEKELNRLKDAYTQIYIYMPGIPSHDTPIGQSDEDNVEVRTWGDKPKFNFKPKTHTELLEKLHLLDLKRGVKVAGFRGYYLLGDLARLHWAVLTYAFNKMISNGFIPVIPPTLVKEFAMFGTGHFPWGRLDAYQVTDEGLLDETGKKVKDKPWLVGTAEVPLMALLANEKIDLDKTPIKLVGFSPAYRKEVGSYSKDLHGIKRLHEFWKVEQVVIMEPDDKKADDMHLTMLKYSEEIMQELKIPYRVLAMCTADMGEPQYKKFDIEAWLPGANKYMETHSASNMADFQCRRNNIKIRYPDGTYKYAYSLNNTVIASPRFLITIVENYQNADGSINIPEALQPLMGGQKILKPLKEF